MTPTFVVACPSLAKQLVIGTKIIHRQRYIRILYFTKPDNTILLPWKGGEAVGRHETAWKKDASLQHTERSHWHTNLAYMVCCRKMLNYGCKTAMGTDCVQAYLNLHTDICNYGHDTDRAMGVAISTDRLLAGRREVVTDWCDLQNEFG